MEKNASMFFVSVGKCILEEMICYKGDNLPEFASSVLVKGNRMYSLVTEK